MKKKKQEKQEQPKKEPQGIESIYADFLRQKQDDLTALPQPRSFDDDVEQGYLDEDQRANLERRQANTGRVLQSILSGRFGV